jgi:hypothetical protein
MPPLSQEIEFVAGALSHAHRLQALLDMPERWTADIRREARTAIAALTGYLLAEPDFALTGDAEGVLTTIHTTHEEACYRLAV